MREWIVLEDGIHERSESRWSIGLLLLIVAAVVVLFYYLALPIISR